jgi:hypothetical protein
MKGNAMSAASTEDLQKLHQLVAKALTQRIELDMKDMIPTDAATLGAAIKLLKDNNISADPADKEHLSELRAKLSEASKKRRESAGKVLEFAKKAVNE